MSDPLRPATLQNPRRARLRSAIGWVISIACIGLIAYNVDLQGVLAAMHSFRVPYLLIGLLPLAFGYTMRIARWAVMLRATGASASLPRCAAPFLGSIALNNVLPLRLGDIVRATVFPAAIGVPRTAAIGSIVMERLVDLLTLLLFLAVGATAVGAGKLPAWLTDGAVLLAVVATGALFSILLLGNVVARIITGFANRHPAHTAIARLLHSVALLLTGVRQMTGARTLALVFALSILAWLGESGVFWAAMAGFGVHGGGLLAPLMVMAFVVLSTLVPSSPGYIGPFHLAAFAAISLLGGDKDTATSFAILSHLMVWIPTTLAGGIAMLVRPELFRGALATQHQAKA